MSVSMLLDFWVAKLKTFALCNWFIAAHCFSVAVVILLDELAALAKLFPRSLDFAEASSMPCTKFDRSAVTLRLALPRLVSAMSISFF